MKETNSLAELIKPIAKIFVAGSGIAWIIFGCALIFMLFACLVGAAIIYFGLNMVWF